ncbi:MAG: hypothetical protein JF599_08570 [Verrucomicrobia bacterium]|nr:hypothetical protein [Verrucomicrobiota bacterium]
MQRVSPSPFSAAQRLLAGLLTLVVLALTVLSVSPDAHAWLHAHEHGDRPDSSAAPDLSHDDGCAITLYAHGITAALDIPRLPAPQENWVQVSASIQRTLYLSVPRYLRQPERGPPVVG